MEYLENKELVEALRRGRPDAWETLVNRYMNAVYGAVKKTVSTYGARWAEADIDDLALSVFENLLRDDMKALARIGEPYDLKSWLIVSARRRTIDHLRARKAPQVELSEDAAVTRPPTDRLPAPGLVEEALHALSDREAMLVRLVFLQDKKYKDAARIMGLNMNSVGPTLMRALEKIREAMKRKVNLP